MSATVVTPELLGRLEPIRGLSPERRLELAAIFQTESYPLGSDPLRSIECAGQFVYLVRGELKVDFADGGGKVIVGACEGACWPFGQAIAMPVSSRAITEVEFLRVDETLLDVMMTWDQVSSVVATPPKSTEDVTLWRTVTGAFNAQVLIGTGLALLPPAHIHDLLLRFERIKVKRGQVLVREGDEGDYYYLIESGKCEVTRHVGGREVLVADLRSGEAFGEEALVSEGRRSATVTMKTDGVLLRLAKPDFIELLKAPLLHPATPAAAMRHVAAGRARWLDVRYAAEFAQDGLPGAINIPLNEIRSAFGVLDHGLEYIVYCQSGRRSSAAAFLLAQHGFKAVWLEGGLAGMGKQEK